MNDDRLLSALARLGAEELPVSSDRAIRARLETAWTTRAHPISVPSLFSVRRFAPVLAALVLVAGFGGTALGAGADSPLWDTRVALETAATFLRSNDERVAYLLDLVQARTEEAARQEAVGHPDAAAKARAAASSAVAALGPMLPQIDTTVVPVASASPTPPPANSPAPSASPTVTSTPPAQLPASGSPTPTARPTTVPTATPVRTATPTPVRTATPIPPASPTKVPVTITGVVKDASGANVYGACISTSPTPPTSTTQCSIKTTTNGSYGISTTTTAPGQSITLYAYWTNTAGQLFSGSSTGTMTSPTTVMPTISLTLRK